jgi:cytochrome bd ubiquinol oxidase subunit I
LSEVVESQQVLGSLVLFGVIYGVLFLLWIIVLNHKIQLGPEPAGEAAGTTGPGLLDAAAERAGHRGSLTEAKQT